MLIKQLGLIGCGLLGGSFALALKQANCVSRVVGYSRSASSAEKAKALGVIDEAVDSALLAATGSDVVLLAVPVAATASVLASILDAIGPDTLVMDVGSTKGSVVASAQMALGNKIAAFVPAHPIAGREVSGVEHAQATLFDGCNVIITPIKETGAKQFEKAQALWLLIGAAIHHMSPEHHDAIFAASSHTPHLLAFAYINSLANQRLLDQFLAFAGSGFRDTTRVAASDPTMWRDIFLSNKDDVRKQIHLLQQQLNTMDEVIANDDGPKLEQLLTQAQRIRAAWNIS
jgi:prephenate dehydrogenase